jgi:ATP-dependent Clp protease protease subunit
LTAITTAVDLATIEKLKHEGRKFAAEAEKLTSEARSAETQADLAQIVLERERLTDRETKVENQYNGVLHLAGEVTFETAFSTMRRLERFARLEPDKPIEFLISSPGGSLLHGLALWDHIAQIRRMTGIKITTVALGMAASMAGILLQAGDTRVMGKEAWLLIHEASFMAGGSMGEVLDTVEWIEKIQERIVDIFLERSKAKAITRKQFVAKWKRKDWWLSSSDALAYGFIDEIR